MPTCYIITHEPTGHFYIGSSSNPKARLYAHMYHLQLGNHKNRKLQLVFTAWEHIKIETFETDTLEEARTLEHDLIGKHHGSPLCCNQASSVEDPSLGVITPEIRRRNVLRAHAAVMGVPKTAEHREKLSRARTGILHSQEAKDAISDAKSRAVEIDGKQYPSLAAAAKELGINLNTLRSRFRYQGKRGKYNGYRFLD